MTPVECISGIQSIALGLAASNVLMLLAPTPQHRR